MAPRVTILPCALLLTAVACVPAPPSPSTPGPGSPALTSEPSSRSSTSPSPTSNVDLASITIDGIRLGAPVAEVLARAPYTTPCDVDPIDQRRATLYFWAAGPCHDAGPFPEQTSVVIVTPQAPKGASDQEQPVELVIWAGGSFFDSKTNLPVKIGDDATAARASLGTPTHEEPITDLAQPGADEPMPNVVLLSWSARVHVLTRDGRVMAIAVGSLEGGEERRQVVVSTYGHHLRFARRAKKP